MLGLYTSREQCLWESGTGSQTMEALLLTAYVLGLRTLQLGFWEIISGLANVPDTVVQKYVARIQSKLQAVGAV